MTNPMPKGEELISLGEQLDQRVAWAHVCSREGNNQGAIYHLGNGLKDIAAALKAHASESINEG